MGDTNGAEVAFPRKYRPKNISEYMGESVRNILLNRFSDEKNFPQTILLHGTRGCGKTSAARLIAQEYHCLDRSSGHACGQCEMCKEIEEKLISSEAGVSAMGVQEVDIASESGKANIDNILEEAMMEPMYPLVYKVLILDEFHMATKQAQNRLLKILEEPPKHLVFILCTTNPENIIDTITSRCQLKIEVKKASVEELSERLLYVCQQEKIKTSMEALRIISKKSDRVPREALMMLENIAKNCGYNVTLENVQKQTGDVASSVYIEYYQAANESLESIMLFNQKLKEMDISPKNFIRGLTRFTLDSLYVKYAIGIEDYPPDYVKSIKKLFKMYNSSELDTLLQIVEYAVKTIDSDDTKAELIITTTAMRIGKVNLLSAGLYNQDVEAEKENKASMLAYKGLLKEDKEASKEIDIEQLTDTSLVTVFGKTTESLKIEGAIPIIPYEQSSREIALEAEDEQDRRLSEEDLINMFNI